MSRFEEYQTYIAIVDQGSLAAAAKHLHLSPSAISKKLSSLEDRLGTILIDRSTRSLAITSSGQVFYERCKEILSKAIDAEAELADKSQQFEGKLNISCPRILLQPSFFNRIAEFTNSYPSIRIGLSVTDEIEDLIEGRYDFVFRIGALKDSRLKSIPLGNTKAIFCAAPAYIKQHGMPKKLSELKEHRVILPTYINLTEKMKLMFSRQAHINLDDFDTSDDPLGVSGLVCAGSGIAMMLDLMTKDKINTGELVQIFPDITFPAQPISLLWNNHRYQSNNHTAFKEYFSNAFTTQASQ